MNRDPKITPHYKSQYRMISKSLKPLTKLDMSNVIEVTPQHEKLLQHHSPQENNVSSGSFGLR
jgi:hypothetical protein